VVGSFTEDAVDYMMDFQFVLSQRYDMTLTFVEPASSRVIAAVHHLPGVQRTEAFRAVAVRMRHGHWSRRVGITGLSSPEGLFRLVDDGEQTVKLPHASVGDTITVEVLEGERPVREVPVAGTVNDYTGTAAYMHIRALNRLMREGGTVSGAFLDVDEKQTNQLYKELKQTPKVADVSVKKATVQSFWQTIAENLMVMRSFNLTFACIIAFGVVYNNARISLAERSRELATLRVIGFTRAEISAILLGELAILTLAAIPLGMAMGYGLAKWATWALDTEMYRIPFVIHPATFGFAIVVVLAATLISGLLVRRRLDHLDLVAVLKTKE
jgi:putative ABC transport system permease protein